jgi:hypothetical protein
MRCEQVLEEYGSKPLPVNVCAHCGDVDDPETTSRWELDDDGDRMCRACERAANEEPVRHCFKGHAVDARGYCKNVNCLQLRVRLEEEAENNDARRTLDRPARERLGRCEFVSFTEKDGRLTTRLLYPLLDEFGNRIRYMTLEDGEAYIAKKYGAPR